jgi:hypothetical protein
VRAQDQIMTAAFSSLILELRRLRKGDVLDDGITLVRGGELSRRVTWMPGGNPMDPEIDLIADLNAEDDEGFGWSVLSQARDQSRIRRGVMVVAGNDQAKAVVRIVAIDEDGQVHFTVLPGSLDKNRHLIGRALA